jgi:hypothetical protein
MLLKIKRSQRQGGVFGGKNLFTLDIRADYTQEERDAINRYKLGGELVYSSEAAKRQNANASAHLDSGTGGGLAKGLMSMALASMNLTITIASLQQGHHIECKDMNEVLEAENTLREACKGLTAWLDNAKTFDGQEIVVEYKGGEEQVHRTRAVQVG